VAKNERSVPKAWTPEYLRRLLGIARHKTGSFHGVPKADYWTAFIHLAWQTGSRASEMFDIQTDQVESDGGLKGYALGDEAKAAVRRLMGPRKYLFGRLASKRELLREFSEMQKKVHTRY